MPMRTRNGNPQDPFVERELAAVDATLRGQPVEADLAELAELVLAVQAERPRPRPRFTEELDARAAEGFPQVETAATNTGEEPRSRWSLRPRRMQLAFGTAASLLIVATAVVSSGVLRNDETGSESRGRVATERPVVSGGGEALSADSATPTRKAQARSTPSASSSLPVPPGRSGVLPRIRNRQVDRDAALVLATPKDKVESIADGVIEVTDRYEGFVLRSNVSGGDESRAGAALELRVPSGRLQTALRDLSELAHVRSRTQTTQDITARFVSARSRLDDALAERRALLRQLARATTPNETASIRARLRLANRQIAAVRSNLRGLRNRVDFSRVSVAIEADQSLESKNGGWSLGDAVHDAFKILGTMAGIAVVSLAVLIPVAIIALLAWLGTGALRRNRRERVLDQQPAN
jgi:uncharacterized protein DUF4349